MKREQAAADSGGASQPVWVVRAGEGGRYASEFEGLGLVGIGFEEIGDVSGMDRDAIFASARDRIGSRSGNVAGQINRFANVMSSGDLVAVPDGGTRELLYGRVSGNYEHRDEPPVAHYRHVRKVEWLGRRDRDPLPDRILFSLGSLLTVFKPSGQDRLAHFLESGVVLAEPGSEDQQAADPDDEEAASTSAREQEARNRELIGRSIARLGWKETQDLTAGVLQALGYATAVASPGADGGIDISACRDPLFLHPPVVKVQVKAKPTTKISPDEIRQLNGLVDRTGERGIFVATGGFTKTSEAEATQMGIQLWDLDRLVGLFLDSYPGLAEETQELVPLRQIWVLEDSEPEPS